MSETPSAPAASHAFAISAISVTLGESFIIIGLSVDFLTAFVTAAAFSALVPKASPPPWTLGHDIFISNQPIMLSQSSILTAVT